MRALSTMRGAPPPESDAEAFEALRDLARGQCGKLRPEALARHVCEVTAGADFPVRRAALDAILRRRAFAQRDGLRVATRPPSGHALGAYTTQRREDVGRPYSTRLDSIDPPRGSCGCPDYVRASLGLCKHLLVVLEEAAAGAKRPSGENPAAPRLAWDPVRPLTGVGDWLERMHMATRRPRMASLPHMARPARMARPPRMAPRTARARRSNTCARCPPRWFAQSWALALSAEWRSSRDPALWRKRRTPSSATCRGGAGSAPASLRPSSCWQ